MSEIKEHKTKRKRNIAKSSLIFILYSWFALSCSNGNSSGNNPNAELTEQIVKDYFTNSQMKNCNELYECKVVFETPIQIGAALRRNINGALPAPDGIYSVAYPVIVDVSFYRRDKGINAAGLWSIHKGGIHYFYRDANSVWNDAPEGVDLTFQTENQ